MQKILLVYYGPGETSQSKATAMALKKEIENIFEITELDLGVTLPDIFNNETMPLYVRRNYKQEELSELEEEKLARIDYFRDQYLAHDVLVLVFPMYNFGLPAAVKAWVDAIAQAKRTFRYTEYGAEGLGNVKRALVLMFTGSTPKGSAKDFASPQIQTILEFIGVKDVFVDGVYGTKFLGDGLAQMSQEAVKRGVEWLNA